MLVYRLEKIYIAYTKFSRNTMYRQSLGTTFVHFMYKNSIVYSTFLGVQVLYQIFVCTKFL